MKTNHVQFRKVSPRRKTMLATFGAFAASAVAASAQTGPPVDMAAIGTTIAGYIPDAATAGLAVFGAMIGVRIIIKGFKAVMQ